MKRLLVRSFRAAAALAPVVATQTITVERAKKRLFCGQWLKDQAPSPKAAADRAGAEFVDSTGPGVSPTGQRNLFKKEPWSLDPDEIIVAR